MKFPAYFLDQLRQVLSPSQVIRKRVRLQNRGSGEFAGLCPFHAEKTPSFTVSDNKGFYHCFGCGAHGDIVKFVMESQGLSFADSVKELALEAGIAMPVMTKEAVYKQKIIDDIYEITEMAARFFEEKLAGAGGTQAREYLVRREVSKEQVKKFRLGFAPDGFSVLKDELKAKGIEEKALLEAGLVSKNERGETYDKFRGRLIFPIMDERGRVIAFGGRALAEGQMPKYLNSPETEIFKKGFNLYNLNNAKETARKNNQIIVVEGYMDVIAMDSAGLKNSVAPMGTALTEQQLNKLWNYANEPIIALDGDNAGKRAMAKVAENYLPLLKVGNSLGFVILPAGLDPDDAIKSKGAEYMRKQVAAALPLSEAIWNIENGGGEAKTPEQIAALEARLMGLCGNIRDRALKGYYERFFKEKLFTRNRKGKKGGQEVLKRTPAVEELGRIQVSQLYFTELMMLKYILDCPKILEDHVVEEEFAHIEIVDPKLDKIRVAILEHIALGLNKDRQELHEHLENKRLSLQILYGKGKNGAGILLRPGISLEEARAGWRFTIAKHNLLQIKLLVEKEGDPTIQQELQKQAKILENIFAEEQQNLESILKIE